MSVNDGGELFPAGEERFPHPAPRRCYTRWRKEASTERGLAMMTPVLMGFALILAAVWLTWDAIDVYGADHRHR